MSLEDARKPAQLLLARLDIAGCAYMSVNRLSRVERVRVSSARARPSPESVARRRAIRAVRPERGGRPVHAAALARTRLEHRDRRRHRRRQADPRRAADDVDWRWSAALRRPVGDGPRVSGSAIGYKDAFVAVSALDCATSSSTTGPARRCVRAVDGVSLTVAPGEFVALYGPCGSGKTTLLLMAAGLMRPDSGSVRFGGRESRQPLPGRGRALPPREQVGFVFQSFHLIMGASAIDNAGLKLLALGAKMCEAARAARPWLVRVGLGDRLEHKPARDVDGRASAGGHRAGAGEQAAPAARRRADGQPGLQAQREVLAMLKEICQEEQIPGLLVTHDPQAVPIADRVRRCVTGSSPTASTPSYSRRSPDAPARAETALIFRLRAERPLRPVLAASSGTPAASCWPARGSPSAWRWCSACWSPTPASSAQSARPSTRSTAAARSSWRRAPRRGSARRWRSASAACRGSGYSAYLLRRTRSLRGPGGERAVQFAGRDGGPGRLAKAAAVQNLGAGGVLLQGGVGLPSGVARVDRRADRIDRSAAGGRVRPCGQGARGARRRRDRRGRRQRRSPSLCCPTRRRSPGRRGG